MNSIYRFLLAPILKLQVYLLHPRRLTARTWSHDGPWFRCFFFSKGGENSQVPVVNLPGCKWRFLASDLQKPPLAITQVDHCSATCFSSTSIGTSTNIQGGTMNTGRFLFSLFFGWGGWFSISSVTIIIQGIFFGRGKAIVLCCFHSNQLR